MFVQKSLGLNPDLPYDATHRNIRKVISLNKQEPSKLRARETYKHIWQRNFDFREHYFTVICSTQVNLTI